MNLDEHDKRLVEGLVAAVTEGELFTAEEARALIRAVVAPTPDEYPEVLERVIEWARHIRSMAEIVDTILQFKGRIEVTMAEGEASPSLRLNPDCVIETVNGKG